MEHPDITRVNRQGYIILPKKVASCFSCDCELYEEQEVIEWEGKYFCDDACLIEYILDHKSDFGIIEKTL